MERRRISAQLLDLRSQLQRALAAEASPSVSSARDRILAQRFFESKVTPAPARVVDFSAARPRPRF